MKNQNIEVANLLANFRMKYPYVGVSQSVVAKYVERFKNDNVDRLYDYLLSQGLVDGVEL